MGRSELAISTKFLTHYICLSFFFLELESWRKCGPSVALGCAEFSLSGYDMINVTGHLFLLLISQKIPLLIVFGCVFKRIV